MISEILHARAAELLELVKDRIADSNERDQLIAGAVLTGAGSMLEGIIELAEKILEIPVRQGLPRGIHGLTEDLCHPSYATAIGLAMFGAQEMNGDPRKRLDKAGSSPWLINRFLSWVSS
jgi:cell division protein FtsA